MRLTISTHPPCKMQGGELRRVPRNLRSHVVGYYVCCPRCGFVTFAFNALLKKSSELDLLNRVDEHAEGSAVNGKDDLSITEDDDRVVITFSKPIRCTYCSVLIHLQKGEAELEEDEHVRDVRYRS